MADYKAMYKYLFRQTERAVRIIQQAQLDCGEIYINTPEPNFRVIRPTEKEAKPGTSLEEKDET